MTASEACLDPADMLHMSLPYHLTDTWKAADREGATRLLACASFALGPTAWADASTHLRHYYRFLGPRADQAVAEALTTPGHLNHAIHAFARAGCHELILFSCNPDPSQIDQLSQVLPGHKRVHCG